MLDNTYSMTLISTALKSLTFSFCPKTVGISYVRLYFFKEDKMTFRCADEASKDTYRETA
jgi:hypothetical protein